MSGSVIRTRTPQSLLKKVIDGALVAFPFIDIFLFRYSFTLFPGPLGYGPLICMYLLLPIWMVRHAFPTKLIVALIGFGALGSTGLMNGEVDGFDFFKVWGGIVLSSTYYWYLWQHLGIDFLRGFQIYINGCIIVSAIGLLVFVDSLFPFGFYSVANSVINLGRLENDFGVRIAATFGEPTYFATTVAPASLVAIQSLFLNSGALSKNQWDGALRMTKWQSVIVLLALILSLSTVAFLGMILALVALMWGAKSAKTLIIGCIFVALLGAFANQSNEIKTRLNSFQYGESLVVDDMHGSSAILYNHFCIATENFQDHPLFGSGLASHPLATERYSILKGTAMDVIYNKNAQDASSMLLRILSEFGIVGLIVTLMFVWLNRPGTKRHNHREMAWMCFIAIALQLFRQGNFVLHGFPFFLVAYALLPLEQMTTMKKHEQAA